MSNDKKDYDVGYKKPPSHTRFQKGQSGNRTGRRKEKPKLPSVEIALAEALNAPVTVTENGRVRRITKFEAMMTQMVNKANSGHHPTRALLMSALTKLHANNATSVELDSQTSAQTAEDFKEEIDRFLDEMAANLSANGDTDEGKE